MGDAFSFRLIPGFSNFPCNFGFYNNFGLGIQSVLGKPIEPLSAKSGSYCDRDNLGMERLWSGVIMKLAP